MNPFKKMFQKSDDDKTLKHSQSMPYLLSLEGRTRDYRPDSSRPSYRGKTPLKKSDIVYVEQAPGVLETHHGKPSQYTHHHRPTRANFEERPDLLAKFPHSPAPTEGLPRSGFRAISLNSNGIRPQVPVHNPRTSGQQVHPSVSCGNLLAKCSSSREPPSTIGQQVHPSVSCGNLLAKFPSSREPPSTIGQQVHPSVSCGNLLAKFPSSREPPSTIGQQVHPSVSCGNLLAKFPSSREPPSTIGQQVHPSVSCGNLLAKFPNSPEPIEGLPHNGFRMISLNSKSVRPQVSVHNLSTSGQQAYSSNSRRTHRHEFAVEQASADVLQILDDHTRSGRLAERIRTTSSNSRSHTPAPPIPTTHGPRPMISRSAHSSRVNLRRVPSHTAILVPAAPDHGHPSRPQRDYSEFLNEQDPNILRRMINEFPVAPLCTERTPAQLRPIRFDMVDSRDFQKTFRESLETAIAQGRPLDARAGGPYRRIIDVTDILDIVLETGRNQSRVRHR